MKRLLSFLLTFALILSLTACGGSSQGVSADAKPAESTEQPEKEESAPEQEPEPEPEPFVVPDPVVYTGSGDDVLEITPPEGIYVFHITGNAEGRHFSVISYDSNGNYGELLVNTTEKYDGITIEPAQSAAMLEISASGAWTVELLSMYSLQTVTVGNTITGTGDSVFITYNPGKTAKITGNAGGHYFGVHAYGATSTDLLVNTTDPYEGTVMLKSNPILVAVTAVDDWSFTLN